MEIMPKFDLFPRLTKLAHFLLDHITDPGLSDHANRGASDELDSALYDQPEQMIISYVEEG